MGNVRVNPPSVKSYESAAQAKFDGIHQELSKLVTDVVNVHYFGENAVKFKTDCGHLATEFANGLSRELGAIAGAVNTATSNIAASLGAARMSLNWQAKPFSASSPPAGDGSVDVDTSALSSLKGTVTGHFGAMRSSLDAHLSSLTATDWTGNAKDQVVGEVSKRTAGAKSKADEAERALNQFIQQQVEDVQRADKA
jgi:hypothetical protein